MDALLNILKESPIISSEKLAQAKSIAEARSCPLMGILIDQYHINADALRDRCANYFNLKTVGLSDNIDRANLNDGPDEQTLLDNQLFPIARTDNTLTLALADPDRLEKLEPLKFTLKKTIIPVFLIYNELFKKIHKLKT